MARRAALTSVSAHSGTAPKSSAPKDMGTRSAGGTGAAELGGRDGGGGAGCTTGAGGGGGGGGSVTAGGATGTGAGIGLALGDVVDVASPEEVDAHPAKMRLDTQRARPIFTFILSAPHLEANWESANQLRVQTSISHLQRVTHHHLQRGLPKKPHRCARFCHQARHR
jgi:hypothetical protein